MNAQLEGKVVLTDAPEFDERWAQRLFDAVGIEMQFTFGEAYRYIPNVPDRMVDLIAKARQAAVPAHRAANDVRFLLVLHQLAVAEAESDSSPVRDGM